ncbi:MAG: chemotaxis protein CheA [Candidatus Eremiobacterota bacterium]
MVPSDNYRQVFKEEAYDLLRKLEKSLLELEENPVDELVADVFRAMHTIKGSGNMFGFTDIGTFTHNIETVFDLLRNRKVSVTRELIDLSLSACDQIRIMLEASDGENLLEDKNTRFLTEAFKKLIPPDKGDNIKEEHETVTAQHKEIITYHIYFHPEPDVFKSGTNPLYILDELIAMGECEILAGKTIPELNEYEPYLCYTEWDILLTTERPISEIKDVFIFLEGSCELNINVADKKDIEIVVDRKTIARDELEKVIEEQSGQNRENVPQEIKIKRHDDDSVSSIRVPSEKLDQMVDLVGELVIAQARLNQISLERDDMDLRAVAEEMARLTEELQDNTLGIRMLPIGTIFSKFRRLVRDLSKELGKIVDITIEGEETELDKTVIERLNDPLVHIIRNTVDHGIEEPQVREKRGKNRAGLLHLSAIHSGAYVFIKIIDDGAGIDGEAILKKALERGLVSPDTKIQEKELFDLIFLPGFSTAETVTSVSGRGVGMDVVKRSIEGLGGSIEVDSKKGEGTAIILKLPLTLAIIDGLLANIGSEYFVFPLSSVEECVELTCEDLQRGHGRHIIKVRDEIVPYIRLRDSFNITGEMTNILEQIVVTIIDGQRIGFAVDNVVGEHQTVIKSLGRIFRDVKGLSGATILGDGSVALILDLPQLVASARIDELTEEKGVY